jgi:MFS family permease
MLVAAGQELAYPSRRRAIATLVILMIAYIVSFLDRQILGLMVDQVRADLRISDFQVSLLQGLAFALFFSVMGIPLGRVSDRRKRTYVIAAGVVWWSLMTAGCGLANSFTALFLFRMGVGVGEAALAPAAYSILGDSFPPDKLVRATSLFGQGTTLGAGVSLLAGGQLVDFIGRYGLAPKGMANWQATFVAIGLPGLLVAALVLLIHEPARHGKISPGHLPFRAAVRGLWDRRELLGPLYVSGTLLAIINFGAVTWFPTHLMRRFGYSAAEVGFTLGPIHLIGGLGGAALGVVVTEYLIRKGNPRPFLTTVAIVAALVGCLMVTPLLGSTTIAIPLWCLSVVLQSAYSGSVTAAIQLTVPNELRGLATATLLLMSNLGGLALGSALIGAASSLLFANDPGGVGKAFALVGSIACFLSFVIASMGIRQRVE